MSVFIISSVSAWSYDNSYSFGDARAYAQIEGSYPKCDGDSQGGYCIGEYYIDISRIGDEIYLGFGYNDWSMDASDSGYSGISRSNEGRHYLPIKNGNPEKYVACAWDYDYSSASPPGCLAGQGPLQPGQSYCQTTEAWAWAGKCGGYLGDVFDELKVVECFEDSNCASDEFCDTRREFTEWECRRESVCENGEEKCDGLKLQKCISYGDFSDWFTYADLEVGECGVECLEGETKCDGTIYITCENNKLEISGEVIGKCGVEEEEIEEEFMDYYRFLDNSCSSISINVLEKTSNDYLTLDECKENIVLAPNEIEVYRLENNVCDLHIVTEESKLDSDYSSLSKCEQDITGDDDEEEESNLLNYILIGGIVIFLVLIIFLIARKKK